MAAEVSGWAIAFLGYGEPRGDCSAARFDVTPPGGARTTVEVRTTAQIEHILALELGKEQIDAPAREAILSVAGRQLIEAQLADGKAIAPLLCLDSRLFRLPGAACRLLQECGLLAR